MLRPDTEVNRSDILLERAIIRVVELEGRLDAQGFVSAQLGDDHVKLRNELAELRKCYEFVERVHSIARAGEKDIAALAERMAGLEAASTDAIHVGPAAHQRREYARPRALGFRWTGLVFTRKWRRWQHYKGLTRSALFDHDFYLQTNKDVAAVGCDPLMHYIDFGAQERRQPSRYFDGELYRSRFKVPERDNPLSHHIRRCRALLKKHSGLFDAAYYLEINPDVKAADFDAVDHFLNYGVFEGRMPALGQPADATARAIGWLTSGLGATA